MLVLLLAIYILIGILLDLAIHLTNRIIYWSGAEAALVHLILITLWPIQAGFWLVEFIRAR